MSYLGDLLKKIFVPFAPRNVPSKMLSPIAEGYEDTWREGFRGRDQYLSSVSPTPTPSPNVSPQQEYAAAPLASQPVLGAESAPEQTTSFDFPYGDKPTIPDQYIAPISRQENAPLVASVLAQETGGYGYGVPDPSTGEILNDWEEIKRRNLRGASGEVGIAQIIPKWHWKDAGFPDEESYAQALYDPEFAIDEAGRILNRFIDIYGDARTALNHWNKRLSYADEVLNRIGIKGE